MKLDPFAKMLIGVVVAAGLYVASQKLGIPELAALAAGVAWFTKTPGQAAAERRSSLTP